MNLQKINGCISELKLIMGQDDYDGWQLWKLANVFSENWDLQTPDFKEMYKSSFSVNSPLWIADGYFPKNAMIHYIDMHPELVRAMFADLFNESKDITGRINRFEFQCQELYKIDRGITEKVTPHYHSDKRMIFVYLAFRYPDQYPLFLFDQFKSFMTRIDSKSVPKPEEIERYIKVSRIIKGLVIKNEELLDLVQSMTGDDEDHTMFIVSELYAQHNRNA